MWMVNFIVGRRTRSRVSVFKLSRYFVVLVAFNVDTTLESLPPIKSCLIDLSKYFIHASFILII